MPRLARPKTLLLLLFFVCWVEARNLAFLFFPDLSSTYYYWDALGVGWVHFAITLVTVALAATAASYLWYPRHGWFEVTSLLIGFLALSTIGVTLHMTQRADVAREAFESGRGARGFPVPPERLEQMFQPTTLLVAAAIALVFFALIEAAAWRRREYVDARFLDDDGTAA
jgi:hypothetical protein